MTCTHVLGLLDAGPFADRPGAQLEAAWAHARECATCGPALEAMTILTADLATLARPTPPPSLSATILARIADIDPIKPAPAAAAIGNGTRRTASTRDWSALITGLGGVAAGLAIVFSTHLGDAAAFRTVLPAVHGIAPGLLALPGPTTRSLVLAAGLVLYVVGMFAPLGGRSRPSRKRPHW